MRSISKTIIDEGLAVEIVHDAFGPTVELVEFVEATEGWFNAAYVLGTSDGRRSVLKVAPPPEITVLRYEHDIMATEVAALRRIAESTTVPVPRVLWSDTSCRRVPSPLFVMECCDGTLLSLLRPSLDAGQQQRIDAQIAGHLRQMHDITNAEFGLQAPTAERFGSWSECFAALIEDLLADRRARNVDIGVDDEAIRSLIEAHRPLLDQVTVARFVHWDLWDSNVFIDPVTLEVTGLIDFERALWGDPLMEAQFYARDDNGKWVDASFVGAYGRAMLVDADERRRRLLYDLYLFLIMVIEVDYRHYADHGVEAMARERLAETLRRLG